jgi:hypothetical protein
MRKKPQLRNVFRIAIGRIAGDNADNSGFAAVFTSMLSTQAKPRVSVINGTRVVVERVHKH